MPYNPAIPADCNSVAEFYGQTGELGSIRSLAFNIGHDEVPVLPPAKHLLCPTTVALRGIINAEARRITQVITQVDGVRNPSPTLHYREHPPDLHA